MTELREQLFVDVYRHDTHKITGHSHEHAPDTFAGVSVNQPVPHGADADASALSRPGGNPTPTVDTHDSNDRLSLIMGDSYRSHVSFSRREVDDAIRDLLTEDDPVALHRAWLESTVAAGFNESVYYPYTSLKYHTLLVAALVANYRTGAEFAALRLVVDPPDRIVPHRTIYADERFALRVDVDPNDQPWARLGASPWRSWASTWSRLTAHPLDTAEDEYDRVLDANLRRIQCWSTALQYVEDFQREVSP